jgi:hypothetical protein
LEKLTEAFMYILLDYYKLYKKHGLPKCDSIDRATANYKKKSDELQEFIDEYYEYKKGYYLLFTDIWTNYKNDDDFYAI